MPGALTSFSEDYAIVIGVDDYGPGIPSLRGCVNDANLFYEWLVDPNGGGLNPGAPENPQAPPNIVRICSPRPRPPAPPWPPVRNDVEDALLRLVEWSLQVPNGRVGRRLYLWFSSHGIAVPDDRDECAALMTDARDLALTRSIPGRRAAENFRGVAMFDEVVLFMDCCRTEIGGFAETVLAFPFQPSPEVGRNVRCLYGFAAPWAAEAAERELSHPFTPDGKPPLWQGVFAHVVLEGLTRAIGPDGNVTSESLANYVKVRTREFLPGDDNLAPVIFPIGAPIVFRVGVPTEVRLTLTNPALGFRVLSGVGFAEVPVVPLPDPPDGFRVSLPPGRYLFASGPAGAALGNAQLVNVLGREPIHVQL